MKNRLSLTLVVVSLFSWILSCCNMSDPIYQGFPTQASSSVFQPSSLPNKLITITPQFDSNSQDFRIVAFWMKNLILKKNPELIGQFVGDIGAGFAPCCLGAELPGYNNSSEIVGTLKKVLSNSSPVCVGYSADVWGSGNSPPSAIIVFSGLSFQGLDLGQAFSQSHDYIGFEFYKDPNNWKLAWIVTLPDDFWDYYKVQKMPCP